MKRLIREFITLLIFVNITGCSITSLPGDVRSSINGANEGINDAKQKMANLKPVSSTNFISHHKGIYLSNETIPLGGSNYLPPVFSNPIQIDMQFYNLKEIANAISSLSKIPTYLNVNKDLIEPTRITQDEGNLVDVLNMIASKTDTAWTYENNRIIISSFETKRWHIDAIPGELQVQNQIQNNSGIQGQAGGSGISVGSSGSSGGSSSQSQANQNGSVTQNVAFNLQNSIWSSLKDSIKAMLSVNGKLSIDNSTSSIVVTDKPSVIDLVDSYIKKENADLNRQVIIDVQVIEVTTNKNDNYGINWNLALQGANASFSINGQAVTPSSSGVNQFTPSAVFVPNNTTQAFTLGVNSGDLSGLQIIINALSSIGQTSMLSSSSHATLSYQPAPFQFVEQKGYLASVTTTQTAQVGSQTALTPGQLTLGYSLNILPVIQENNQVLLQVSLNLSSLNGMSTFSSQGAQIQLPDVQLGNTLQKIKMRAGDTFVMSGFDSNTNQIFKQGVGSTNNWLLGGGITASQDHNRMVILITPHITG